GGGRGGWINEGVAGAAVAYATGAAVMTLPWVLTTAVLLSLSALTVADSSDLADAGVLVNTAFAVAMLVAGPLQIVISRHAADRLYHGRPRACSAPPGRGLGAAFVISGVPAAAALLTLGLPPRAALWGAALSAAVGAQWTALAVGNGLCAPSLVLGAVGAGAALSFLAAA